ncbi:unnamed protein product, partial [Mesorhabditis belari]|uniref:Double-strand-break repair protein rad21 n=1 Tax=Mesorhabditis belari TaxID=2138241 RepID=A0AAF3EX77_9BILA
MFYAQFVLSKKGPLAKIWLAAHWEKKLSKAQIYETNVQDAVDEIIKPKSKMALRTTGHLLLGIVRIYSRKAKYLLADCNEAFLKIKMAFRPGITTESFEDGGDMMSAPAIQLPEVYADFDSALPDFNDVDLQQQLHINQSRIDDITLKEDLATDSNAFGNDFMMDDFGESKLGAGVNFDFDDNFGMMAPGEDFEQIRDFGNNTTNKSRDIREPTPSLEGARAPGANIFDDDDMGGVDDFDDVDENMSLFNEPREMDMDAPGADLASEDGLHPQHSDLVSEAGTETYPLGPLETASITSEVRRVGRPRKRRLVIDEPKNISGDEMKSQMANYADTLQPLDLAPPTRKLMKLRECGNVEKLFHLPGNDVLRAKALVKFYQSSLLPNVKGQEVAENLRKELEMSETVEDSDIGSQTVPDVDDFDVGGIDDMFDEPIPMPEPGNDEADSSLEEKKDDKEDAKSKKERKSRQAQEAEEEAGEGDEEHRFTKRTQNVLHSISTKLRASNDDQILLSDLLTKASNKKTAAQKFYTLLVLKKWQAIDLTQSKPFDDIVVTAGPNIDQTVAH